MSEASPPRGWPPDPIAHRLKVAALGCLALPVILFAALAIGELGGGEVSGLQHLVQLLPLPGLAWLGWTRPRGGGVALIVLAVALALGYVVLGGLPLPALLVNAALLFGPPLVAGLLFIAAARRE